LEKIIRLKNKLKGNHNFKLITINQTDPTPLRLAHTPRYIKALLSGKPAKLANSSGLIWQPTLPFFSINSAHAAIKATQHALKHQFGSILGPGGHHATKSQGYGFNPTNQLAISSIFLLKNQLVKKIAILDLDAHYANGTHSILKNQHQILKINIFAHSIPKWQKTPTSPTLQYWSVSSYSQYQKKLKTALSLIKDFKPNILLYHSGMDIYELDRTGGIKGFTPKKIKKREQLIISFAKTQKIPLCLFMGGGYINYRNPNLIEKNRQRLTNLHLTSFQALLDNL